MSTAVDHGRAHAMTYQRGTYQLHRFEVVAPAVRNDGSASGYARAFRRALTAHGFEGWSEFEGAGYWDGKREEGTTFVIYSEVQRVDHIAEVRRFTRDILAGAARACMPDQVAIQLVVYSEPITLVEA